MPQLTLTTHIDAPRDRVFALCADLERAAEHIDAIERIEMLTDGPIGVGTRFRETRIMFKKEATETMEITSFEPPHSYAIEATSCGSHWRSEFRFIEDGPGRTRVELHMAIQAVSLFAKLMSPLSRVMMGAMRKCIERDLADIKRVAEGSDQAGAVGSMAPAAEPGV